MKVTKEITTGFDFIDELKEIINEDDFKVLNKVFKRVEKEISESDLDNLIQGYSSCFDVRAQVMNSTINGGEMDSMTSGCLYVDYDLDYYLGCRDINHTDDEQMTISISINEITGTITLTGEDIPVREPDEY